MKGLKEKRVARGMTQAELAKAIGVSQSVVSVLEREDIEAGDTLRDSIAAVFESNVSYVYVEHKEPPQMSDRKVTQNQKVLTFMRSHDGITQKDAIGFGCYRLSGRIYELRKMGYVIRTENVPFKSEAGHGSYAHYRLLGEPQ